MFELFILLVLTHLVADYVFQTDSIALGKNNTLDPAKFGSTGILSVEPIKLQSNLTA